MHCTGSCAVALAAVHGCGCSVRCWLAGVAACACCLSRPALMPPRMPTPAACRYLFAMLLVFGAFAASRAFHIFRAGLLGLAAPLLVLLMDTANVYFYFNGLDLTGGCSLQACARARQSADCQPLSASSCRGRGGRLDAHHAPLRSAPPRATSALHLRCAARLALPPGPLQAP